MIKIQNKHKNNENMNNNNNNSSQLNLQTLPAIIEEKPFKKIDFLYLENTNLILNYGPIIYQRSIELEKDLIIRNLLEKHKIDEKIRTKMVDWMIEVLHAYKSDTQTLFLAVSLMDLYMKKCTAALENSSIHLLGITCMYIMSKYEDVIPIRISSVTSKISHKAYSE